MFFIINTPLFRGDTPQLLPDEKVRIQFGPDISLVGHYTRLMSDFFTGKWGYSFLDDSYYTK
jgi:hypothetical protein